VLVALTLKSMTQTTGLSFPVSGRLIPFQKRRQASGGARLLLSAHQRRGAEQGARATFESLGGACESKTTVEPRAAAQGASRFFPGTGDKPCRAGNTRDHRRWRHRMGSPVARNAIWKD